MVLDGVLRLQDLVPYNTTLRTWRSAMKLVSRHDGDLVFWLHHDPYSSEPLQ